MARMKGKSYKGGLLFCFLLLVVICMFLFTLDMYDNEKKHDKSQIETGEEKIEPEDDGEQIENIEETAKTTDAKDIHAAFADEHRRMFEQLTDGEKQVYLEIRENIQNGNLVFDLEYSEWTLDNVWDVLEQSFRAVYFDYPEFFWINRGWKGNYDTADRTVELNVSCYDYWNYVLDKEKYKDAVYSKAEQIVSEAMEYSTTYDRIKYVHDYLVMNVEYNDEAVAELNSTVQKASSQQSHTAYGALVNDLAVCDGYTKAFQMIMNMLNIECEYIEGNAGEAHAWNYMKLDGESYWMDVTWDDYNFRDEKGELIYPKGVNYDYYCITSEKLYRTHEPNQNYDIPVCDAYEYNFYVCEKAFLETYNFDDLCDAMERQRDEQIINVQFSSLDELHEAVEDLLTVNMKYYEIPRYDVKDFGYLYNEEQYTLSFLYP